MAVIFKVFLHFNRNVPNVLSSFKQTVLAFMMLKQDIVFRKLIYKQNLFIHPTIKMVVAFRHVEQ